jgi:hypothetical protein
MTLIELAVIAILITLLCGVLVFFWLLYQIMKYIDNIEMYGGGDTIVGNNPDTTKKNTTSTMEKILQNSRYGAFPTDNTSPNTPDTVYKTIKYKNKIK